MMVSLNRFAQVPPRLIAPFAFLVMVAGMCLASSAYAQTVDPAEIARIEAVAYDYVDGQLEGDAARVARSLHPNLAKRAIVQEQATSRELFPLRRMSADELIQLTRDGALKTPKDKWQRTVKVLDVVGNVGVVRVDTPWFTDFFHMGRFGTRWLIVNAMWMPKPKSAG